MSNQRQTDTKTLHPEIRDSVVAIRKQLRQEGHNFEVFEAWRSPDRQAFLYAKGRTTGGSIVTKAKPWRSYHQYGLAVDMVLKINGNWSWRTDGKHAKSWDRLREVANAHGMETLNFEKPHIQLAGVSGSSQLFRGDYPSGGDKRWADKLIQEIAGWEGRSKTPPLPNLSELRPGLPMDDLFDPRPNTGSSNRFNEIVELIFKYEGGYVNDPDDRGGPTNMGITLATLQSWRGQRVTARDVQKLSKSEARKIYKARYFDKINADQLNVATACVTFNNAVLSGPKRASMILQQAIGDLGAEITIDGVIGPKTIAAAGTLDDGDLADRACDFYMKYLKQLSNWWKFGKGWTNRVEHLREFAANLEEIQWQPPQAGPVSVPLPTPRPATQQNSALLRKLLLRLVRRVAARGGIKTPTSGESFDGASTQEQKLLQILKNSSVLAKAKSGSENTLTPVNAALGTTIGNALNGRKTAMGIVGILLAMLVPELNGELADVLGMAVDVNPADIPPNVAEDSTNVTAAEKSISKPVEKNLWLPIFSALTAWGGLGKIDKWVHMIAGKEGR